MKKIIDICDKGQGYDDSIKEVLAAFQKFRDGYYELIDHGDEWWDVFNQSSAFDKVMTEAWNEIDTNHNLMDNIEVMAAAMLGNYINFNKFVNELIIEECSNENDTDINNDN